MAIRQGPGRRKTMAVKIRQRTLQGKPLPGIHPVLDRIYRGRGVQSLDELHYGLDGLLPPWQLKGIQTAARRLADAIEQGEKIVIVADFDADGATGCAVGVRSLRAMGYEDVTYRVPDRQTMGYGLTPKLVASMQKLAPALLVTVDNGVSSVDGVKAARKLGFSVVITDHHLPGEQLPDADAMVNPNQPGCDFPEKSLAGVGVMFYTMVALRAELDGRGWFEQRDKPNLAALLDLVALGTVADLVPLEHNNRRMVDQGLKRIRAGRGCPGINALMQVAGREIEGATASDFGFAVGPRLNAAGRLDDMRIGIQCLITESQDEAMDLAAQLDALNRERRRVQNTMQDDAEQAIHQALGDLETANIPPGVVMFRPGWHAGVVGLVASRVKDQLHRPTVIFAAESDAKDTLLKGSGRSIPGLHLRDCLAAIDSQQPGLIEKFGGHAMAAGLTIASDQVGAFSRAFAQTVEQMLEPHMLEQELWTDGTLEPSEIDIQVARLLETAGPWGQSFPDPTFYGEFDLIEHRIVGEKHWKIRLRPTGNRHIFDAIWFNAPIENDPEPTITIAYSLDINRYKGVERLQLRVIGESK